MRVAHPAHAVGEPYSFTRRITGIEARMNVDQGAGLVRCRPERIEVRGIEHAADAARQGRNHRAGKSR